MHGDCEVSNGLHGIELGCHLVRLLEHKQEHTRTNKVDERIPESYELCGQVMSGQRLLFPKILGPFQRNITAVLFILSSCGCDVSASV